MEIAAGCEVVLRFWWSEKGISSMRRLGGGFYGAAAIKNVEKSEALVVVRRLCHRLVRRTRGEPMLWRGSQRARTASRIRIMLLRETLS